MASARVVLESIPPLRRTTAGFMRNENAKFEIRISKQARISKFERSKLLRQHALKFRALAIPICFGFRNSNFEFHFFSGYSARTVSAIPPRAENCAVTMAWRGAQAFTKSSRMRFVTASLNARSLRYDAR